MALRNSSKIFSITLKIIQPSTTRILLHKNRMYMLETTRNLSFCSDEIKIVPKKECPSKACNQKKPKKPFWKIFHSKGKTEDSERPSIETCRRRLEAIDKDPDLSCFEGKPYRTCGTAFIIQKDIIPTQEPKESKEDQILRKIEAHPSLKNEEDPMPPFQSVEQRLIDLSERKLHPFYKRYMTIPKTIKLKPPKQLYETRSGPITTDEIPVQLKFNKELMEKKNLLSDFKRVMPPQQLIAKMVEMKKNQRPTLEKKNGQSSPAPARSKIEKE